MIRAAGSMSFLRSRRLGHNKGKQSKDLGAKVKMAQEEAATQTRVLRPAGLEGGPAGWP